MSPQQSADRDLRVWQENRRLTPRERMEIIERVAKGVANV